MDPESHQFEQLRRLLVLKRYEQPPPGYFNRFSGQVIARIQAGERGEAEWTLLQRWWMAIEGKPGLAGAFGAAVCVLLISAIVSSNDIEMPAHSALPTASHYPSAHGFDSGSALALNESNLQPSMTTNPAASLDHLFTTPALQPQRASVYGY
jgi:hypothetical protein